MEDDLWAAGILECSPGVLEFRVDSNAGSIGAGSVFPYYGDLGILRRMAVVGVANPGE